MNEGSNSLSNLKHKLTYIILKHGSLFVVDELVGEIASTSAQVAKILSRWHHQGWIKRIKRGVYLIVPQEIDSNGQVIEDPWILVPSLFGQDAYIGGWSAAEHWGLTEQIFNSICVFTTNKIRKKALKISDIVFVQSQCKAETAFGTEVIWRERYKISVSDPSKTIIDMLANPCVGGGIKHCIDCFKNYIYSNYFDKNALIDYAQKHGNKSIFKRLGYISSVVLKNDAEFIDQCHSMISHGNSQLDPSYKGTKLITYWNLFIPEELALEE
jgi:predicted transcriptional regulator of viral defense system